ncbi:conserved hypothetical protein [Planktothrix agardhii]|nr:conserved hypothetical protein [Planktothrix agardhii]
MGARRTVFKQKRTRINANRVGHTRSLAWGESHLWLKHCKVL